MVHGPGTAGPAAGLAYVFFRHPLSSGLTRAVGLGMILLLFIFPLATLTVFARPIRTVVIGLVARAARAVTRRDLDETLAEFSDTMAPAPATAAAGR